ncbi:hypothetical protein B0H34DRAFT_736120 [Crassisporium funariophilum]|nr:hypothetical protein B0H34DRAFT_736120 [Crassisporium funariophilum]
MCAVSESDHEHELTSIKKQRLESWESLCSRIPNFRSNMVVLASQQKLCRCVSRKINEGINNVQAEDASSLRASIIDYLLLDTTGRLDPPIQRKGNAKKSDRGFSHPTTASSLCPLKYDTTQQTYNAIIAGKKSLTAHDLPRFLYPDGHVYNLEDIDKGLLTGHLPLCVAKHIFQGPTAALERPGYHHGKRGNAALMGMTMMTPCSISYVAVQV